MWTEVEPGRPGYQGKHVYYIDGNKWCLVAYDSGPHEWCISVTWDGSIDPVTADGLVRPAITQALAAWGDACREWRAGVRRIGRTEGLQAVLNRPEIRAWLWFYPGG